MDRDRDRSAGAGRYTRATGHVSCLSHLEPFIESEELHKGIEESGIRRGGIGRERCMHEQVRVEQHLRDNMKFDSSQVKYGQKE